MIHRVRELRQEEGFTLVELLIVIIILGVLAGIVVFAVGGITNRGAAAACRSDFKNVEVAQEAKFAKDAAYGTLAAGGGLVPTYLREAPSSTSYAINTGTTGAVTATVGTTTGGIAVCDSAS